MMRIRLAKRARHVDPGTATATQPVVSEEQRSGQAADTYIIEKRDSGPVGSTPRFDERWSQGWHEALARVAIAERTRGHHGAGSPR